MPSATFDKLNQLKAQLEQCNNETAALLLKRTITKLESQLQIEQLTTGYAKETPKETPKTSKASTKHQSLDPNQVKENSQTNSQEKTAKVSQTKHKTKGHRTQRQPLLPGNGTHRAWCWIPGIIRIQELEVEGEQPAYVLELSGYQIPLSVRNRHTKLIGASLDKPLMVKCYPQIIDGQIKSAQFCGTDEPTPEKPEDWILIGVWNADKQRVLVQRDWRCDRRRRILQHSPLVHEECLEQLEGRKLYRFECQREGITVTVVGVECLEGSAGDQGSKNNVGDT